MDWFKLFYTLLGGLGVFFLGMTQLSESLQSIAGTIIKKAISWLTTNRLTAVIVGLVITTIIQSSSITTVMVVSFVNAGLMNLSQAIGVIFGSNIGTTITGWIIAIKIGKYGLALIGIGIFPMLFAKKNLWKNIGKLFVALGLVFFGLELMSSAFKPLRSHEGFLSVLTYFSASSIFSILGCVLIGATLTMIIQSSSAMLGITMAMATTGVISFQTSAALILGENIGTTITAILASITGNSNARRAAAAHATFNVLGVSIMVLIFHPYINFIEWLIGGASDAIRADGSKPYIAAHIAATHSIFNISATILFLPFLKYLAKFVSFIIPSGDYKEAHRLTMPGTAMQLSPELAIEEAYLEVRKMNALVRETIERTKEYILSDTPQKEDSNKVSKYETITDKMQAEIFIFLTRVLESPMSEDLSQKASGIIRASDELESIADYCDSLVKYRNRLIDRKETFSPGNSKTLTRFLNDTLNFYDYASKAMSASATFDRAHCLKTYEKLNEQADNIREIHLKKSSKRAEEGTYAPITALTFSDMIVALRRIKNHSLNFSEALTGGKTVR